VLKLTDEFHTAIAHHQRLGSLEGLVRLAILFCELFFQISLKLRQGINRQSELHREENPELKTET